MQKKSNELDFCSIVFSVNRIIESFWCPLHAETMFYFIYEEYDNFAENQINSLDQQAMWV